MGYSNDERVTIQVNFVSYFGGGVVGPVIHWSPSSRTTKLNDICSFPFTELEHCSVVAAMHSSVSGIFSL